MVNPGQKLSLQKHVHRAEHWVVVTGSALVTRNEEHMLLHENESVHPARRRAPAGKSRKDSADADRGAVRTLSRGR